MDGDEIVEGAEGGAPGAGAVEKQDATITAGAEGGAAGGTAPVVADPNAGLDERIAKHLAQRDDQWRGWVSEQQKAYDKAARDRDERLLAALNPDYAKQREQPKYATVEEIQRLQHKFDQTLESRFVKQQFYGELGVAKEKFPRIAQFYGQHADVVLQRAWESPEAEKAGKSVSQVAAEIDAIIAKNIQSQQQEVIQNKQAMQKTVRGNGAPGKAPDAKGDDHGYRGRARLVALRTGKI